MGKEIWYLSFVDEDRPVGKRWMGGCYVLASNMQEAVSEAWRCGCNPGGQVGAFQLNLDRTCRPEYMNRLLNKTEVDEACILKNGGSSQYYYMMVRYGMTGGTPRSVFKMLCTSPEWQGEAEGVLEFAAGGVPISAISWSIDEFASDEQAQAHLKIARQNLAKVLASDPETTKRMSEEGGFPLSIADVYLLPIDEAMRIEKGEAVDESPGAIAPETVEKIVKYGDQSKIVEMSREEFEKATGKKLG
jgi:hypothetical protein